MRYVLSLVVLVCAWQTGCFFEPGPLEARQCSVDSECPEGQGCLEGFCGTVEDDTPTCASDGDCDDGQFCNGAEACAPGEEGADDFGCVNGDAPSLDDGIACTQDACDEATDEVFHVPGVDCECNQEGDPRCEALFVGVCETGACDTQTFECVRQLLPQDEPCDDGIACTEGTACDGAGQCVGGTPQDSACDNMLFCDGPEICDPLGEGADPETGCVAGVSPEVEDGSDCTDDICDENNDIVVHVPNGECTCNEDEDCRPSEPDPCLRYLCRPDNTCATAVRPQGTLCDDGVACTDADSCDNQGECSGVPINARCDDNAFCDGPEFCDPDSPDTDLNGCVQGQDPVTELGPQPDCVDVRCDEVEDEVVLETGECGCPGGDAAECPPAPLCQFFICTPELTCELQNSDAQEACEDGVSCTEGDSCDGEGACTPGEANDGVCDNGLFCDGAEVCEPALPDADPETGCRVRDVPVVDDGVDCTVDNCDEEIDEVTHIPDDGFCSDGLFCNGEEICDVGLDCTNGVQPVVDDGLDCTVDTCDDEIDEVLHVPDDGVCDNGLFCDGEETCDPDDEGSDEQTGCLEGDAPVVDDGIDCTLDDCDEENDTPTNTPDDGLCDNGLFCDGAEVCDPADEGADEQTGCLDGDAPVVDDGVDCTVDDCDEEIDEVTNVPDNSFCADAEVCNGAEVCDPELDCQQGTPLDDGADCGQIECGNDPQDATCQSGTCVLPPEGTTGDEVLCGDELDNDCDGQIDGADSDCTVPQAVVLEGPQDAQSGLDGEGALLEVSVTGATNQATNLYCVSRMVAEEESFDTVPEEDIIYLDAGDNVLENQPAEITFGVPFEEDDDRLGASVCDGFSLIYGPFAMPSPDDEHVYGHVLTARLGNQAGELASGQYLVMSYKTDGTGGKYVPLILVGGGDEAVVREYSFALFNGAGVNQVEVRFEVIDKDDNPTGLCGFVEDVRLELSPVLTVNDDGSRTHPDWTYGNGITEAASQNFNGFDNGALSSFFVRSTLANSNHNFSVHDPASVIGNNAGMRYRFKVGALGFVRMPSVLTPLDFDRTNPLMLDLNARMVGATIAQDEVSHVAYGQDVDLGSLADLLALRKLTSVLPPNLGSFTHFTSHYTLGDTAFENRYAIVLPEEVKPLVGRDIGFLKNRVNGNGDRLYADNLSLYAHTAPTDVDLSVEALGPEAYDSSTHLLTLQHALEGKARVQCFWQIPGDPETATIASEDIRITFE